MNLSKRLDGPADTYTLKQFISMKSTDEITYRNLSILDSSHGLEILDHNLLRDYIPLLDDVIVTVTLSTEEMVRYRYAPDLLAYDVYGTPDLGLMIMILNDKECPSKFILRKRIRLIPPNRIGELYETITTRSSEKLEDNWAEQLKDMER